MLSVAESPTLRLQGDAGQQSAAEAMPGLPAAATSLMPPAASERPVISKQHGASALDADQFFTAVAG